MASRRGISLLVLLSLISKSKAAVHFKSWYGQFREVLQEIVQRDCRQEYQVYLTQEAPKDYLSMTITPVIDCILGHLNETRKSNIAAAAVLLGLLPTTLGGVGSTTVEVGLVALRRPFLAFLLAAGAPAVSPMRTFDYVDTKDLLAKKPGTAKILPMGPTANTLISSFEYIMAAGAVVNLAFVSYELCIQTVCSFAPEDAFLPALWAFLAIAVHFFGTWSVYLRTRIVLLEPNVTRSWTQHIWRRICAEFTPSAAREVARLEIKDETYLYIFLSWFTSMGTVLHIVYGTLVFSSILFISTSDAVTVVARYLASTLVCRAIVMYELSGLRQVLSQARRGSHGGSEFIPLQPHAGTSLFDTGRSHSWQSKTSTRTEELHLLRSAERHGEV
ncbi:hypothetical protein G647_09559 [Cladophialophora carrionii CBS 160.54]|uniref:Solute carrier family 40 protein n=1 Tax=Cladophialophora carrionii CBS 160.54 TaxID=1279043 RepID=V9DKG0_9EURO|nr:uncharacterized protein G647_09559 [Cladophialophora carrionii CBS 160.54]ETI27369.1 hypothetical protein G647_09559 [Cladophialophora carrionii CBS 160.54]